MLVDTIESMKTLASNVSNMKIVHFIDNKFVLERNIFRQIIITEERILDKNIRSRILNAQFCKELKAIESPHTNNIWTCKLIVVNKDRKLDKAKGIQKGTVK